MRRGRRVLGVASLRLLGDGGAVEARALSEVVQRRLDALQPAPVIDRFHDVLLSRLTVADGATAMPPIGRWMNHPPSHCGNRVCGLRVGLSLDSGLARNGAPQRESFGRQVVRRWKRIEDELRRLVW